MGRGTRPSNVTASMPVGIFFLVAAQERIKESGWGEALKRSLSVRFGSFNIIARLRATLPPDPSPGFIDSFPEIVISVNVVRHHLTIYSDYRKLFDYAGRGT